MELDTAALRRVIDKAKKLRGRKDTVPFDFYVRLREHLPIELQDLVGYPQEGALMIGYEHLRDSIPRRANFEVLERYLGSLRQELHVDPANGTIKTGPVADIKLGSVVRAINEITAKIVPSTRRGEYAQSIWGALCNMVAEDIQHKIDSANAGWMPGR